LAPPLGVRGVGERGGGFADYYYDSPGEIGKGKKKKKEKKRAVQPAKGRGKREKKRERGKGEGSPGLIALKWSRAH